MGGALLSVPHGLIDSNIFILLFNGKLIEPIPDYANSYSLITEIELLAFPNLDKQDEQLIRSHLKNLHCLDINEEIKEHTIALCRSGLKIPDALICATALHFNIPLFTNDKRLHQVTNLRCIGLQTGL